MIDTLNYDAIKGKIRSGVRLSEEDAIFLFEKAPLAELGALADQINREKNGNNVFFNINRHINPTNICVLSCKFCAFSRKPGEEGAYAFSMEEILERAKTAVSQGATELHMVGGLHPRWNFRHYLDMIATLHQAFPDVHIKAFTAVELDWMARKERRSVAEILTDLKAAGLGSIPGGGAEIFHPEIREKICDTKVSAEQWIDTHRTAHKMGMRSNCTMLYGHIESYRHRVDHMKRLRDLQDETQGFNVFIPLSFQPDHNDMGKTRYTLGSDDLRTVAVARLFLDNFKHIKSYWVMMGQDIAQIGLRFGANDLDGTVTEEKISRMAGGRSGVVMSKDELARLIEKAGGYAVERDTLYRPLTELSKDALSDGESIHALFERARPRIFGSSAFVTDETSPTRGMTLALEFADGEPDWEDYKAHCRLLAQSNPSHILLQHRSTQTSQLTAIQWLQMVLIARSELPEKATLAVHLDQIPTMTPQLGTHSHPASKVIPLAAMYGVREFYGFDAAKYRLHDMIEDFQAVGLQTVTALKSDYDQHLKEAAL